MISNISWDHKTLYQQLSGLLDVTLSQNVSCLEEGRMCHMHVHTVLRRPLTSQTVGATGKALSRLLGPFPDPSAFITLHPSNPAAHNAALWENAWVAVTSRMQPALPLSRCYITVCSFFFLFSSCRFWGSVRRWWHPVTSSPKCLHSNDGSYPNHFTTIFFSPLPQYFFFLVGHQTDRLLSNDIQFPFIVALVPGLPKTSLNSLSPAPDVVKFLRSQGFLQIWCVRIMSLYCAHVFDRSEAGLQVSECRRTPVGSVITHMMGRGSICCRP